MRQQDDTAGMRTMYEFHGWFGIAETPDEVDAGSLDDGLAELRETIAEIDLGRHGQADRTRSLPCPRHGQR
jgi:hypothetical protein